MALESDIKFKVRGVVPNWAEGDQQQGLVNNRGEQLVAHALPPLTQLVSAGNSWWARTSSAAAPVVAVPTTAALIGLWNGESGGGKAYVIDSVFVTQIVVTAAIQAVGILANISTSPVLTALANTIAPRNLRALRPYNGLARIAVGITLDGVSGVADNWMPLGLTSAATGTLQIGTTTEYDVKGGIIIPPQGLFALTAIAGAATAGSVHIGFRWHEVQLPGL